MYLNFKILFHFFMPTFKLKYSILLKVLTGYLTFQFKSEVDFNLSMVQRSAAENFSFLQIPTNLQC